MASHVYHRPVDLSIPGLGILGLLALLLITGALTRNYLGKRLIALGDAIVRRIPLANRLYKAIREIAEALFSEKRELFKEAVLFEYPRPGLWSIGFFTQNTQGPVQDALDEDVVSVFLPTTPNPTSGYLLFVPKRVGAPAEYQRGRRPQAGHLGRGPAAEARRNGQDGRRQRRGPPLIGRPPRSWRDGFYACPSWLRPSKPTRWASATSGG